MNFRLVSGAHTDERAHRDLPLLGLRTQRRAAAQDDVDLFLAILGMIVLEISLAAGIELNHVHTPSRNAHCAAGGAEPDAGDRVDAAVRIDLFQLLHDNVAHAASWRPSRLVSLFDVEPGQVAHRGS
jgi:hypothetical protein